MTSEEIQAELLKLANNRFPAQAKIAIVVLAVMLFGAIAGFAYYKHIQHQDAVVLTEKMAADNKVLAEKLNVSEKTAAQINAERAKQTAPVYSYVVQSKSAEEAAQAVKKDIDAGTSIANKIPADRTLIVPQQQEYKVEVSRITLDKKWAVGGGALTADGKVYPVAAVEYNAGRISYELIAGQNAGGFLVKYRF